jgi:hypothetical protein
MRHILPMGGFLEGAKKPEPQITSSGFLPTNCYLLRVVPTQRGVSP